jgi:hypothetical protein
MAEEKKPTEKQESPKIIVDDDWKAAARAEKERLSERVEQGPPGGAAAGRELPPASFATLVNSLAAQAMLALGGMEDPRTHRRLMDLDLAKHHIDTLSVIEEKTRGNLSDEERKLLDQALYQSRMLYVQISQSAGL